MLGFYCVHQRQTASVPRTLCPSPVPRFPRIDLPGAPSTFAGTAASPASLAGLGPRVMSTGAPELPGK